ncbi:hypothetical protein GN956_G16085 [Arapaima gigas]
MATAKKCSTSKGGSVRFSEDAVAHSHVHFDDKLHDSVVMVMQEPDGNFLVKVGFLKIQHKYEIIFTLPKVPALGTDVCPAPVPNPHLCITDVRPTPEGGLRVTCEYMAHQEGVLREEMMLVSESKEDACLRVRVQARVMDRHHGTPMLLEGVRCVGVELDLSNAAISPMSPRGAGAALPCTEVPRPSRGGPHGLRGLSSVENHSSSPLSWFLLLFFTDHTLAKAEGRAESCQHHKAKASDTTATLLWTTKSPPSGSRHPSAATVSSAGGHPALVLRRCTRVRRPPAEDLAGTSFPATGEEMGSHQSARVTQHEG